MKKKTTFGLLGLAAAGAGAAGGWAALGNYLYNRVMVPQLRDPEEEDINPVQAQGRQWARKLIYRHRNHCFLLFPGAQL